MTFDEILREYQKENGTMACEPPAYLYEKQQGEFTAEDFECMPESTRFELIDGEFVYMGEPIIEHQRVMLHLGMAFEQFILSNKGTCKTHLVTAVLPDESDNKTELVPDVIVLCDRDKEKGKRIVGGPDLVIEILSPSTRHRDLGIKKRKYLECGVREYWTVDLEKRYVTIHEFESEEATRVYAFNEKVPVGIFNGLCQIDFNEIMKMV